LSRSRQAGLVQDTAWEGHEEIPGWIVEGCATLFAEIDDQLADLGHLRADVVRVPTGVGSLLQAALTHYRRSSDAGQTAVVSVEPTAAAGMAPSLAAGHRAHRDNGHVGPQLRYPLSPGAAADVGRSRRGVAVTDHSAIRAAHDLAARGVPAGPCGAASLAGARAALTGPRAAARRHHLGVMTPSFLRGVRCSPPSYCRPWSARRRVLHRPSSCRPVRAALLYRLL